MSSEDNTTGNEVSITIGETTISVDPALLRAYKTEVNTYLQAEVEAKAGFKEAVETMAETFGVEKENKTVLSKWLKASFKAETKKASALAEAFEQLDDAAATTTA